MKKALIIAIVLLLIASAVFGIHRFNQSRVMVTPLNKNIRSVTWQEYCGDEAVNEALEIPHDKASSPDNYYFGTGYNKVLLKRNIPERCSSLRYVISCDDGSEVICYEYSDGENTFMELPGKGIYSHSNKWNGFKGILESYHDELYSAYYAEKAESKSFTLADNYNGAGKAIFVDLSDEIGDNFWWDRFIPDEYTAAGPQDVRYVIVQYLTSSTYIGYWYVPETGERLSDEYDETYSLSAFDLMTGEETVLIDSTYDVFDINTEIVKDYLDQQQ